MPIQVPLVPLVPADLNQYRGALKIPTGPPANSFPWTPTAFIPDSELPVPLRRNQPFDSDRLFVRNAGDSALAREADLWKYVASHGGIKSCCQIPELGAPIWSRPPWQVMPSTGVEFRQPFAIGTGGMVPNTDVVLGQFRVPLGYDGVLNQFIAGFAGTGHNDFSGDLIWRCKIGQRYAKNLGNVQTTLGSFGDPFLVPGYGIRLLSGQTVTLIARTTGAATGTVSAGAFGWFYPRR